jgi:NTP pyrophosphatase (non-canonical NTP hydrolase)
MTDINWTEQARECHEIAASKGWWDGDRDSDEVYALIHSEVSEALEAWRKTPDEDEMWDKVAEELVDVAIRILDWAGHWEMPINPHAGPGRPVEFGELFATLHHQIARAWASVGSDDEAAWLSETLGWIVDWFRWMGPTGLDLSPILEAKKTKNRARPHRHGGLRA